MRTAVAGRARGIANVPAILDENVDTTVAPSNPATNDVSSAATTASYSRSMNSHNYLTASNKFGIISLHYVTLLLTNMKICTVIAAVGTAPPPNKDEVCCKILVVPG